MVNLALYFLTFTDNTLFLLWSVLFHRAMSLCTTAYPTSIRTTDVMWSPGMTANWMATSLRWRYNVGNVTIITWRDFNKCLLQRFNFGCFLQNPSKECEPYRTSDGLPIAPCGAIANSLFNGKWDMVNSFASFSPVPLKLLLKALYITKLWHQVICCTYLTQQYWM